MEILKGHVKKRGFDYFLVTRNERVALYRQELEGRVVGYEVFLIQHLPERTLSGHTYPETEAFPPDEAWGAKGFTYYDEKRARQKFTTLSGGG